MKDIAIYGAGGLGREIACLIRHINGNNPSWNFTGFFDDGKVKGSSNEYGMILGGMDDLNAFPTPLDIIMAIGSPRTVRRLTEKIINPNIDFPNLISPDIIFLDKESITLGKGNIFCSRCFISIAAKIGDFNLFNGYITLGHDVTIGNYNAFMPAVRISGEVSIGNENFFGVSSVVLQRISIGENTVVGANSLIISNTNDDATYVGNPAKRLNREKTEIGR
jgi:sugar O-acyltransferase (sialic acid O-acetyltransferase NeuD family)